MKGKIIDMTMEDKQRILERELQKSYKNTKVAHKKYNKWLWIKIFNKRNLKQVVKTVEHQNKVFKQLREVTRENHPEQFIKSEDN